jgi:hypothetical protein
VIVSKRLDPAHSVSPPKFLSAQVQLEPQLRTAHLVPGQRHPLYRLSSTKATTCALLSVAGLLERLEKSGPTKVQKLLLANTYTRLAMLEDSANDTQGSKESMSKARYWYTASGRADHSDSEMKAELKLADEQLDRLGLQ